MCVCVCVCVCCFELGFVMFLGVFFNGFFSFFLLLYFLLFFSCLFDTVEHAGNVFSRCSFVQIFSSFQGLCMPYIFMKLISYAFSGSVLKKFIAQGASMF